MNAKIQLAMLFAKPAEARKIKRWHDEHYRKSDKRKQADHGKRGLDDEKRGSDQGTANRL